MKEFKYIKMTLKALFLAASATFVLASCGSTDRELGDEHTVSVKDTRKTITTADSEAVTDAFTELTTVVESKDSSSDTDSDSSAEETSAKKKTTTTTAKTGTAVIRTQGATTSDAAGKSTGGNTGGNSNTGGGAPTNNDSGSGEPAYSEPVNVYTAPDPVEDPTVSIYTDPVVTEPPVTDPPVSEPDSSEPDVSQEPQVSEDPPAQEPPSSNRLSVNVIYQYPELPTGCETTALTILLRHLGYNADKVSIARYHLPKQDFHWSYGTMYGADFRTTFAGNPENSYSYGCLAPCIVTAANSYLGSVGAGQSAYDISGRELDTLFRDYIDMGRPVLIWITSDNLHPTIPTTVWMTPSGETVQWLAYEHCVVLTGYDLDAGLVYVSDPLSGNVSYDLNTLRQRYNELGRQSVCIG
ncbi:MAG: C39 family peptidase [Ruminococcus sp.]|nr:C39 family peptidase [Ruminococcus sp.]